MVVVKNGFDVHLAETYDGVILDLLNREALSAQTLRTRLETETALPPQIRIIGGRVDRRAGIRTVGLPKYGFPDLFYQTNHPRRDVTKLSAVVDALLTSTALPAHVRLKQCRTTTFDYGCYELFE